MKDFSTFAQGLKFDTAARMRRYKRAFGSLFTDAPALTPGLVSLAQYEPLVLDQGGTESCNGHRCAAAIYVARAAGGLPLEWVPSPRGIYRGALTHERAPNKDGTLSALQDVGCMTTDAIMTMAIEGVGPMGSMVEGRNSDCSPNNVCDELGLEELETNTHTTTTGAYNIDTTDIGLALRVMRAALVNGYPVGLDVQIDGAFMRWGAAYDEKLAPLNGYNQFDSMGGHAILLTELRISDSGDVLLAGLNSWGDWGGPPLAAHDAPDHAGINAKSGHWVATPEWAERVCMNAVVFKTTMVRR